MYRYNLILLSIFICFSSCHKSGKNSSFSFYNAGISTEEPVVSDHYLMINATANDAVYTTYTAAMCRSRLYGDKGYKMDYYSPSEPLHYSGDQAGRFYTIWMVNKLVIDELAKYYRKPVIRCTFPDMVLMEYQPFQGVLVQETFFVHSSDLALVDLQITNTAGHPQVIDIYPVLELGNDSLQVIGWDDDLCGYITHHYESRKRLISNLSATAPYPTRTRDLFSVSFIPYSYGAYKGSVDQFYNVIKTDWYSENRCDSLNLAEKGFVDFVSIHGRLHLNPGEKAHVRYFRGWQDQAADKAELAGKISRLKNENLQPYADDNVNLFRQVPRINFRKRSEKMVYLSAFNLVRGCMLPPEGAATHNFYVFSRNPLWGWGHGHQVLHESLSMLAYVYLDPLSAQGSQRVYIEQQDEDGLIAYRHGPRGAQTYPHQGKPTTSAPFFSWINLELFRVSNDTSFLADAYESGKKYVHWLLENRDTDHDGLFEWGPYGIIENVRDWYNVVFQVSKERHLDIDKEDISDELECLDLSLMVVKEIKCLAEMAQLLKCSEEASAWKEKADAIAKRINAIMWDESTGFYYHVDKVNHSFMFMDRNLKRMEIIGFLPLWAGVATKEKADILVGKLTDPLKFWRRYGVPTLAADDEWYSPYVDYCCKWNGPVWLLWDYLIFRGLLDYGYERQARQLAGKMLDAVITQLSVNHNFWESYSADNTVLDCPPNYIWDAIMAKVIIDLHTLD